MDLWDYCVGNLYQRVASPLVEVLLVAAAILAGAFVGLERERKSKAAGLRTVTLICVGSAIFTMISIQIGGGRFDPARIAAQIVPGIGFLGAGAIFRMGPTIVGLTTAATIWTVAAIGVVIGAGHAGAGIALSAITFTLLTCVQQVEQGILGPCRTRRFRVAYDPDGGKTLFRIRGILDEHLVLGETSSPRADGGSEAVEFDHCDLHPLHRTFQRPLAELPEVKSIQRL